MASVLAALLVLTGGAAAALFGRVVWERLRNHPALVRRRARHILQERLGRRPEAAPTATLEAPRLATMVAPAPVRDGLIGYAASFFTRARVKVLLAQLDQSLTLARIPLKAAEFLYITAGALIGAILMVQVSTADVPTTVVISLVAGMVPFAYLRVSQQQRLQRLDMQVADALLLMVNSLRAGASFMDAMDAVAHEMPMPICEEFARTLRDISLGVPVEEAFSRMGLRCHSEDLDLAVTAFMVQRETGGNLSEILDNIAATIRDRTKLKQEIRTLSAQGKLSGMVLCCLPIGLALVLEGVSPGYTHLLFAKSQGRALLSVCGIMQIIGALAIIRIVKIEV